MTSLAWMANLVIWLVTGLVQGIPSTPTARLAVQRSRDPGRASLQKVLLGGNRKAGSSTLVVCYGHWNTAPNCFDVINFCRVTFLSRKAGNCLRSKRYPSLALFRLAS